MEYYLPTKGMELFNWQQHKWTRKSITIHCISYKVQHKTVKNRIVASRLRKTYREKRDGLKMVKSSGETVG